MNTPIYRAKNVPYGDYIQGDIYEYTSTDLGKILFIRTRGEYPKTHDIDPSTLAIHFPNMIDKNGKKIFASLSEDGVGGDVMPLHTSVSKGDSVLYFDNESMSIRTLELFGNKFTWDTDIDFYSTKEVIGIHKGTRH